MFRPFSTFIFNWESRNKKLKEKGIKFYKYPCCTNCNSVLSAKALYTFEERIVFLYNHLLKKSQKFSFWTNGEIEELDGELKRQIKAKQLHYQREISTRLRGMEKTLSSLEDNE